MNKLGGSIGIAMITNKLAHSQQIQQVNLVQHVTMADPGYRNALAHSIKVISDLGVPTAQAAAKAVGYIYQELLHQASVLAFLDSYQFIAAILVIASIAAVSMPNNIPSKKDDPDMAH